MFDFLTKVFAKIFKDCVYSFPVWRLLERGGVEEKPASLPAVFLCKVLDWIPQFSRGRQVQCLVENSTRTTATEAGSKRIKPSV